MIIKMKTEQFLANHYFCYITPTYIYTLTIMIIKYIICLQNMPILGRNNMKT